MVCNSFLLSSPSPANSASPCCETSARKPEDTRPGIQNRMTLRKSIRKLLNSPTGKQLYKLRQQSIEPIFGNIKHNLGYTLMHLRTLKKVNAEWQIGRASCRERV